MIDPTPPVSVTVTTNTRGYSLTKADFSSIGKGLLVAVGGAALTYLSAAILKTDFTIHYGTYGDMSMNLTPIVYVLWSSFANIGRKILDGITPTQT